MKDFIWIKDHDLEPDFCNHVIQKFEQEDRKKPGCLGYNEVIDLTVKRSTDFNIVYGDSVWEQERKIFYDKLHHDIHEYCDYLRKVLPDDYVNVSGEISDSGYQIQRTDPGEFYIWHSDALANSTQGVRLFTYLWYLNDVVEDGYTEFICGTKVEPRQGRLLMFPASWDYIHRGYPPKSQSKYIVTGWLYDKGLFSAY